MLNCYIFMFGNRKWQVDEIETEKRKHQALFRGLVTKEDILKFAWRILWWFWGF